MKFLDQIMAIDRRIIFITVALAVMIPLLLPLKLPIDITPPTRSLYDAVDKLPPQSVVMLSFDYDPGTMPELYPVSLAVIRHCLAKDLRIIVLAIGWAPGIPLAERQLQQVAEKEFHKKYGIDYVNLGAKPPAAAIPTLMSMAVRIADAFPQDNYNTPLEKLPLMQEVHKFSDVDLIVDFSAGDPGLPSWVAFASQRFHRPVGGATTAVSAPQFYPYLQAGQLVGLVGGMKGAAEYERLVKRPGTATKGMDAQSVAHLLIVTFIVIGNITFFAARRKGRSK